MLFFIKAYQRPVINFTFTNTLSIVTLCYFLIDN